MTEEEYERYKREKRKLKLPLFFKRKVFIVTMTLICSAIMVGMATYAWFILATAPEVKGVTTTIGANGSLEMALLNNETAENTSLIQAKVGDSISIVGAVVGNVTWGNLVDLSDASYGLNTLVLYPSVINAKTEKTVDTLALLSVPKNGLDGRITHVTSNTATGVFDGTSFLAKGNAFGVRAVGTVGKGSSREATLSAAKSSFKASLSSAKAARDTAFASNGDVMITVAAAGRSGTFSVEQVKAMQSFASGLRTTLDYILTAYKQTIIAISAADTNVSDSDLEGIRAGVIAASGNDLSSYANHYAANMNASDLNTLSEAISNTSLAVDVANNLLFTDYGTEDEEPVPEDTTFTYEQIEPIIQKLVDLDSVSWDDLEGTTLTLSADTTSGVITVLADYTGSYETVAGLATLQVNSTKADGKGLLSLINLENLRAPASPTTSSTNNEIMTNFYGYVLDLAFRTNAAADLQLQSKAIDRIYTDGAGATAGEGSQVVYNYSEGMTEAQIKLLMDAVRVVFFNPDDGELYGSAKLNTPVISDKIATAELHMIGSDLQVTTEDSTKIMALEQAVPKKLSVLVYLDGTELDNRSVLNAENSGTIKLNLQFSSSAELKPMIDNDLKNATSAESFDTNG